MEALLMRFSQIPELLYLPAALSTLDPAKRLPALAEEGICGELPKYSARTWAFGLVWVWKQQFYKEVNSFHCKMDTLTFTGNLNGLLLARLDHKHLLKSTFSAIFLSKIILPYK